MFELKQRNPNTHKGDYGKVLIIGGSKGMAGAAVLCAKGALRSGAGLVQISVPPEILEIVQIGVTEATCIARESILANLEKFDAIAFGPGIGIGDEQFLLLQLILEKFEKILVIDADGLNLLSIGNRWTLLKESGAKIILTPHEGEANRLLYGYGKEKPMDGLSKQALAAALNKKSGATIVLKGNETLVFNGEEGWTNKSGNPGMATGGAGDVLTGIILSLAGQGYEPEMAAKMGVYIHGLAGDLAREEVGEHGLIAGDICYYTAIAMKKMVRG